MSYSIDFFIAHMLPTDGGKCSRFSELFGCLRIILVVTYSSYYRGIFGERNQRLAMGKHGHTACRFVV